MRTLAILPVKSFTRAKQRLRDHLDPATREALVEAMFADVLGALRSCSLDGIIVVTASPAARRIALEQGARVLEDQEQGHSEAAGLAIDAAVAAGAERVLLVPGDCPALNPEDIERLLDWPSQPPSALIVPDRHGTGTNALLLDPPGALGPSFGPGSCQRHMALARAGAVNAEVVEVPSLLLDVDTPEDLESLAESSGHAAMTRRLLSGRSTC